MFINTHQYAETIHKHISVDFPFVSPSVFGSENPAFFYSSATSTQRRVYNRPIILGRCHFIIFIYTTLYNFIQTFNYAIDIF